MNSHFNYTQKILKRYVKTSGDGNCVESGDFITISPEYVMTHDNTSAVIAKFSQFGIKTVFDNHQLVFTIDHDIQNKSKKNINKYKRIQEFAKKQKIKFYPPGRGIGHQVLCEEGFIQPGSFVVASDSHANMYGGLGCLGTPVVRADAACLWATGEMWWVIPGVVNIELKGKLKSGVSGKDAIIALCGYFNKDEVLNSILEFSGEGIENLSISERLTIANMSTEWGALAAVFPPDQQVAKYLKTTRTYKSARYKADKGCKYSKKITLHLESIQPYVSGPNSVKVMKSISAIQKEKISINKAYLVSCVNSRVEDLASAANILAGRKVNNRVSFYIAAASEQVEKESKNRGDWQKLLQAGAIPLPSGCGPCIGLGAGILEDGEVGISATNRNFKGRMGSRNAFTYLASPSIVAYSALKGYIAGPVSFPSTDLKASIKKYKKKKQKYQPIELSPHFPKKISSASVFCNRDNINTDGIYPGKYTYNDNLTDKEKKAVVMKNYDPKFIEIMREGDILVGGMNFGTGSSREQAATVFKLCGITMIVAGSFSQTYVRNALNNGLLTIESPELIRHLRANNTSRNPSLRLDSKLSIEFSTSTIKYKSFTFPFRPIGAVAQELYVLGGLEGFVKRKLKNFKQKI